MLPAGTGSASECRPAASLTTIFSPGSWGANQARIADPWLRVAQPRSRVGPLLKGVTVDFVFDLIAHETTRLAAVLDALGDSYDPVEVEAGEAAARRMLMSNLSHEQAAIRDELIAAGVLPPC